MEYSVIIALVAIVISFGAIVWATVVYYNAPNVANEIRFDPAVTDAINNAIANNPSVVSANNVLQPIGEVTYWTQSEVNLSTTNQSVTPNGITYDEVSAPAVVTGSPITPQTNERWLLTGQTNAADNGVWLATAAGTWVRPSDYFSDLQLYDGMPVGVPTLDQFGANRIPFSANGYFVTPPTKPSGAQVTAQTTWRAVVGTSI